MNRLLKDFKSTTNISIQELSKRTINHLRLAVCQSKASNVKELSLVVIKEGLVISSIHDGDDVVHNITLRVLKIIHEESVKLMGKSEDVANRETLHKFLTYNNEKTDQKVPIKELCSNVKDMINEYVEEINNSNINIASQGVEHIHADEVILTTGYSLSVEWFLKKAYAGRQGFRVVITEAAPSYSGHDLAKSLSAEGIDCTMITDSAIFAIMSHVNKVILGAEGVFANGGIKARCGSHLVALAAKQHSVPLYVLAATHQFSNEHYCDTTGKEIQFNR